MTVMTIRNLPVELTPDELHFRSMRLAEATKKIDEVQEKRRSQNQAFYRELKDLTAERRVLTEVVTTGTEVREVKCEERKNYGACRIEVVRLDTGEIVDTIPMREADRQLDLTTPGGAEEEREALAAGEVVPLRGGGTKDVTAKPRTKRKAPGANNPTEGDAPVH
jgi:hypothetical protein